MVGVETLIIVDCINYVRGRPLSRQKYSRMVDVIKGFRSPPEM